jgi:flagellar assembly protein FliH
MSDIPGLTLFAHDFDAPAPEGVVVLDEPEPEAPPPVTAEMVEAARQAGLAEGLARGRAEATAAREAARQEALARLTGQMEQAAAGLAETVEQAGSQIAQLVLAAIGAAFPALAARHGGPEVARFTRDIVALLAEEPRIVIRVHPDMEADVAAALAGLEPERRTAVLLEPRDSLAPGDARIAWRNGLAVRDATGLWARVQDILGPLGLEAPPPPAPAERRMAPAA